MKNVKPEPINDIVIPKNVDADLFMEGYRHGMQSTILKDFRYSFREGFRAAQIKRRKNENGRSQIVIKTKYKDDK